MLYVKILVLVISFFTFSFKADAAICDKEHVTELKKLANQVEISYEYIDDYDPNSEEEIFSINRYKISVNLLSDELFLVFGDKTYYYSDSVDGLINLYTYAGDVSIKIGTKRCGSSILKTVNAYLPKYNTYSTRKECNELKDKNLDICDPWYQGDLNEVSFHEMISKYLAEDGEKDSNGIFDTVFKFFGKYYMFILGGILLVVTIIIGIKYHKKRSVLE